MTVLSFDGCAMSNMLDRVHERQLSEVSLVLLFE